MNRTGCCYDNAVMKRCFCLLKHEWIEFEQFEIFDQARLSVFRYIECFYSTDRLHQSLGFKTPDDFEQQQAALAA